MIYEDLYRAEMEVYASNVQSTYRAFTEPSTSGQPLDSLLTMRDTLLEDIAKVESITVNEFQYDVFAKLEERFVVEIQEFAAKVEAVQSKYASLKAEALEKEELAKASKIEELERKEKEKREKSPAKRLSDKHSTLLSFQPKLNALLEKYGISSNDVEVDENITFAELEALLDTGIACCEALTTGASDKVLPFLATSLQKSFIPTVACCVAGAPILFLYFVATSIFSARKVYNSLDGVRVAESLMYDIDFEKFYIETAIDEDEEEDVECEAPTEDYDVLLNKELEELEEVNPQRKIEEERMDYISRASEYSVDVMELNALAGTEREAALLRLNTALDRVDSCIAILKEDLYEFGTRISESPVMSNLYTLGLFKETISKQYVLQNINTAFAPAEGMRDFVKLMLCNMLLNVKEKYLTVTIYDPDNMGSAYNEFLGKSLLETIKVQTGQPDILVQEIRKYLQDNIKTLGNASIDEFNQHAYELGMITKDYKLVIVLSGWQKLYESEEFKPILEYSPKYGVIIWAVDQRVPGISQQFTHPFEGVDNPYPVTAEVISRCLATYSTALMNSMPIPLMYGDKFINNCIPPDKYWKDNTDNGIELNFGFEEGDPSKSWSITLGDDNVHALVVGGTGSGKSVMINQMLCTLLRRYSPKTLELVMVDFKCVEFAMFADNDTLRCRIPHAKILSGTKDGEYAISVFAYLMDEMLRRTKLFADANVKKLEEYNKVMRAAGKEDMCIPRILVVIDEFQVMFTETDNRTQEKVTSQITSLSKLARFCGCHMLFASQSMKNTISKDIMDQFTLRIALKCSETVSEDIIGSNLAGRLKTSKGFLYTNTSGGNGDPASTVLWKIPYIPNKEIYQTLDMVNEMCAERDISGHSAYFYNSEKKHSNEDLLTLYATHDFSINNKLFMLGERTSFSLNNAPVNFNLTCDDNENIAVLAFEREDLLNLTMTFIENIQAKAKAKLLISCADSETTLMLGLEDFVEDRVKPFVSPTFELEEWLELISNFITQRKETGKTEFDPIFIMCIQWEKYRGMGREENSRLERDIKTLFSDAPNVGIHLIFIDKGKNLPTYVINMCNHRIAAKCDENSGYRYVPQGSPSKLAEAVACYAYGSTVNKFKIYQHTFERTLPSREIIL